MELEIIGNFEIDYETGFGHLGTNKFQLNAKRVRIIRFIEKKNRNMD